MATYRELLARVKGEIDEIGAAEARERHGETLFVDVRERDEWEEGIVPGAVHIPRGNLESRIEGLVPDRSREIVLYCSGGSRSAFAAKALQDLGYEHVTSLTGGFTDWKRNGFPIETPRSLSPDQRRRYSRHLLIPEVGEAGQERLLGGRVLLIGAGGLGSPASLYLAAAGVGTLGIVDADVVDDSNLQRQIVHSTESLGEPKVESAKRTIQALNPDVEVKTFEERLTSENVERILGEGWDVIVDGADNFPTRYLVNDASIWHGIPVVHGSIYRFEGQVTVFNPGEGPCYRCLFPSPPPPELAPSCAEGGVLGVLPGIVGSLQANEALKLVLGIGDSLQGRLLLLDALGTTIDEVAVQRDPRLPGLRGASLDHRVRRLRRVLCGCAADDEGSDPTDPAQRGRRRARARGHRARPSARCSRIISGRYPALEAQLFEDGALAPFVNVYVGGEDVRTLDGLETRVNGSSMILLPAMAGGC